jgi:hypothetical protein
MVIDAEERETIIPKEMHQIIKDVQVHQTTMRLADMGDEIREFKEPIRQLLDYDKITLVELFASRARGAVDVGTSPDNFSRVSQELFGEEWNDTRSLMERAKLNVIGEAAILEYNESLHRRSPMVLLALACYLGACVPIGILTMRQCMAVATAAGWLT